MNSVKCILTHGIILALTLCVLTACTQKSEKKPPERVNLQLKWIHQAQFAGFYMAQDKGFYADERIEVNFIEGGKEVDVLTSLVSGNADFAVASSEMVLVQRQNALAAITAIAAIYRKSAVVYVTKADSGISGPADFIGKTAAVMGTSQASDEFEYQFNALMKKRGVDVKRINRVIYDPTYTGFYSGQVDITAAYYTGGVVQIRDKGYEVNLIWPSDYGIHFYSDTLITTEKTIDEKPDLTERFLRATLKGWREAIADPGEAVEITMNYAKVKDRGLQADMLSAMAPLVHTGKGRIGWMNGDVWNEMHQVLVDQKILDGADIDLSKVYTLQFLESIYSPNGR